MNFLNDNCCLKLNYLICGSNKFSSKKLQEKSIINEICLSSRILSKQENSSIDDQLSDRSYSTLNNKIIKKNVILHRNNPYEQLGLTLCYRLTSNYQINIYIQQVEKTSIADYQGKLQHGDQIIKINNQRIKSRDQAIQLIHQNSTIILQIIPFQNYLNRKSSISLSLNDLIYSQNLFDNENERIIKPLPFKNYQYSSFVSLKEQRKKQFQKYQQRKKDLINTIKEDFYLLNKIFLRENKQELVEKPYLAIKYKQQSNIEKQKLKQIIQKYPLHHPLTAQSMTNISINNDSYNTSNSFI